MSAYPPPNFILSIWNIKNYTYLDEPLTIGEGDDRYYEQDGRIVQTRTNWGLQYPPVISDGAICTRATTGSSTWCIERANTTTDAGINLFTGGSLSYRMGIQTTSSGAPTGVWSIFNQNNQRILFVDPTGNLTIVGSYSPSDINKKKDISDNNLGLEFINKLNTKRYRMKTDDDTDGLRYGLIYQEVDELLKTEGISFKGLVESEDEKRISYTEFIAPLIKAVQELTGRVKVLEQK